MAARAVAVAPRSPSVSMLQTQAVSAYALCEVAPDRARTAALAVIALATEDDPAASIMAMRALGLALRSLEGPNAAARVLLDAVRLGERHALARPLAEVKMTYAAVLADLGRIAAA